MNIYCRNICAIALLFVILNIIFFILRNPSTLNTTSEKRHPDVYSVSSNSVPRLKNEMDVPLYPAVYSNDILIMSAATPEKFDIPRIFHIQWKNDMIPDFAVPYLKLWQKYLPHWKFMFWSDKSLDDYVKLYEKAFQVYYFKLPTQIHRVDMMRYVILYNYGGMYADIDVEPLRSFDTFLGYHSCVVSREPEPHPIAVGLETSLLASNHFMLSRKYHPFWTTMLADIRSKTGNHHPVNHVGPAAVTGSLRNYYSQNQWRPLESCVFLAPSLYFYPPPSTEESKIHLDSLGNNCKTFGQQGKLKSNLAKRYCLVYDKEHRLDFSDMYSHPKYFNASFARHHKFSSWFSPKFAMNVTTPISDIFKTGLLTFETVKDQSHFVHLDDPFSRNDALLKDQ